MSIQSLLIIITLCQPADTTVPSRANLAEWNKGIYATSESLAKLTHDAKFIEIKAELSRLQKLYSKQPNEGYEVVAMSRFLKTVIEEAGFEHGAEVRSVCLPFAEAVVSKQLPIPAKSDLLKAQIIVYQTILDETWTDAGRQNMTADDKLRKERVRILVTIWRRVVESRQYYSKDFPPDLLEELGAGRAAFPSPELPNSESLITTPYVAGMDLDLIKDPAVRKVYKAYHDKKQQLQADYIAARGIMDLKLYLQGIRNHLERLYGKDRKTWEELKLIIASEVKDEVIAKQVLNDLTRKKQP